MKSNLEIWAEFISVLPDETPPSLSVSFDQLQELGLPPPAFKEFVGASKSYDLITVTSSTVQFLGDGQICAAFDMKVNHRGKLIDDGEVATRIFGTSETSRAWKWLVTRIVQINGYREEFPEPPVIYRCPKCSIWIVPGQPHGFCPVAIQEKRELERVSR